MVTKKTTSVEVAKLAGVSQSAVSRVFTPGASSSKRTSEKFLMLLQSSAIVRISWLDH